MIVGLVNTNSCCPTIHNNY
uniref:Uncharacterized protein n=1 Tax=Nymphaea colorata TaxID=210225 RepID=A0A5K1BKF3_9MAGN